MSRYHGYHGNDFWDTYGGLALILVLALAVAGVMFGLSPRRVSQVRALYGVWEAQVLLQEDSTETYVYTDGDGRLQTGSRTVTATLDQKLTSGSCNPEYCEPVKFPDTPGDWTALASGRANIYIDSQSRQTIFFEDLELPEGVEGAPIPIDYSALEYAEMMPAIGTREHPGPILRSTVNWFGRYGKPVIR
jgi:hypothetical protein